MLMGSPQVCHWAGGSTVWLLRYVDGGDDGLPVLAARLMSAHADRSLSCLCGHLQYNKLGFEKILAGQLREYGLVALVSQFLHGFRDEPGLVVATG